MATFYVPVCTTNLQILAVICCTDRHIHHMSRPPFLILKVLDFNVYVVMTPIFPANQRCASSSKIMAILYLWSKRTIIAPNILIDSQHYKRHKRIRMTEFHSPSLSILIIIRAKNFRLSARLSRVLLYLGRVDFQKHLFYTTSRVCRKKKVLFY